MNRRAFLISIIANALLSNVALGVADEEPVACVGGDMPAMNRLPAISIRIAETADRTHPGMAPTSAQRLLSELPVGSIDGMMEFLRGRIGQDFAEGRIVYVNGWMLSDTELALSYLSACPRAMS
jgi:hypothetical protein